MLSIEKEISDENVIDIMVDCFRRVFYLTNQKCYENSYIIVHIVVEFVKISYKIIRKILKWKSSYFL